MDAVRRDQCERSMEGRGDGGDILMKLAVPGARVRDTEYEQVVALGGLLGERFLGRLVVLSDGDVDRRPFAVRCGSGVFGCRLHRLLEPVRSFSVPPLGFLFALAPACR